MYKHIGWMWVIGFFGLLSAAAAQTPSASDAITQFDGTYAFVSATKMNETYMAGGTRPGLCLDKKVSSLIVMSGQARYSSRRGYDLVGTVGSQGELATRVVVKPTMI